MASDDYIKKLAPEGKLPKITEMDVLCRVAAILLDTTPGANRKPPRVGAGRLEAMPLPAHLQERLKEFAETQARPITDVALIERMRTEATKWINAIHMQARRVEHPLVNPDEPGDEVWRQEIDLHFLLVALTRLRRAVGLVTRVQPLQRTLLERLVDFDDTLPGLAKLRNAAEHFDDYTTDQGRNKSVKRYQLQTWSFDKDEDGGIVWVWLEASFSVNGSHAAAKELYDGFMQETAAVLRLA